MSMDAPLSGDDEPVTESGPDVSPIADWQVDLVRKALDARGLITMADRKRAIEQAAGREVSSLRALTHDDAIGVFARLGKSPAVGKPSTSLWDDREEDTWIDRL